MHVLRISLSTLRASPSHGPNLFTCFYALTNLNCLRICMQDFMCIMISICYLDSSIAAAYKRHGSIYWRMDSRMLDIDASLTSLIIKINTSMRSIRPGFSIFSCYDGPLASLGRQNSIECVCK